VSLKSVFISSTTFSLPKTLVGLPRLTDLRSISSFISLHWLCSYANVLATLVLLAFYFGFLISGVQLAVLEVTNILFDFYFALML